ncbi:MAG: hypothetical protein R3D55_02155 [Chloroflexota bacterium]
MQALAAVTEFATASIEKMAAHQPVAALGQYDCVGNGRCHRRNHGRPGAAQRSGPPRGAHLLAEEPPPKGLGNILTYHIPASVPAFQKGQTASSLTEVALGSIPIPEDSLRMVNG